MALNVAGRLGTTGSLDNNLSMPEKVKASKLQIRPIDPKVYQLRANYAGFVAMLSLIGMKKAAAAMGSSGFVKDSSQTQNCYNPKFEWLNEDVGTPLTSIAVAPTTAASDTTITVATGTGNMFKPNDLIYDRNTGEAMLVSSISGDVLTVVRGWGTANQGSSGSSSLAKDDVIVFMSSAFAEGSDAAIPIRYDQNEYYNYCQIFKKSIKNTNTNEATRYYSGVNNLKYQRKTMFNQFILEKARAFFLGKRAAVTTTNADGDVLPRRTTGGLDYWITSKVHVKNSFTYGKFMDFCESAYEYGGDEKVFVCNPAMAILIQKEVLNNKVNFEISPKSKEFGINFRRILTVAGGMDILIDRTMGEIYDKPTGFALETDLIEEMVLRPDKWEENIQSPGEDCKKEQIICESGLRVINEKRHAKLIIDALAVAES